MELGGLDFGYVFDRVDGRATSSYGCQEVLIHKVGEKAWKSALHTCRAILCYYDRDGVCYANSSLSRHG